MVISCPFLTTPESENPRSIMRITTMKGTIAMILAIMNCTIVLEKLNSLRYFKTATQERRVRKAKDFCSR